MGSNSTGNGRPICHNDRDSGVVCCAAARRVSEPGREVCLYVLFRSRGQLPCRTGGNCLVVRGDEGHPVGSRCGWTRHGHVRAIDEGGTQTHHRRTRPPSASVGSISNAGPCPGQGGSVGGEGSPQTARGREASQKGRLDPRLYNIITATWRSRETVRPSVEDYDVAHGAVDVRSADACLWGKRGHGVRRVRRSTVRCLSRW